MLHTEDASLLLGMQGAEQVLCVSVYALVKQIIFGSPQRVSMSLDQLSTSKTLCPVYGKETFFKEYFKV